MRIVFNTFKERGEIDEGDFIEDAAVIGAPVDGVCQHIMQLEAGDAELCAMLWALADIDGCNAWDIVLFAYQTPWGKPYAGGYCTVYRNTDGNLACAILPHRPPENLQEELWSGSLAIADEARSLFDALCIFGPWREYLLTFICKIIVASWQFRQANMHWET